MNFRLANVGQTTLGWPSDDLPRMLTSMNELARDIQTACLWEATARKAGNVHRFADFHDLTMMRACSTLGPQLERQRLLFRKSLDRISCPSRTPWWIRQSSTETRCLTNTERLTCPGFTTNSTSMQR